MNSVEEALEAIRGGGFVVVMDDESRENEGDLVMAAQFANPTLLAFMVRHTNGILCCPMTQERAAQLKLEGAAAPGSPTVLLAAVGARLRGLSQRCGPANPHAAHAA